MIRQRASAASGDGGSSSCELFFFFRHSWHFWAICKTPVCYVHKWAKCFIKPKSKNELEESASSILFYWLCQDDVFYPTKLPD